jgi:hypothetical protein
MRNDDRELRRDFDFGMAPGDGGRCQGSYVRGRKVSGAEDKPIEIVEVDFQFQGHALRGLEQNPETSSRWAGLAREGKNVMQFLSGRRYIAAVVDGRVQFYGKAGLDELKRQV